MVQWFPGHMKKTTDEIKAAVNSVDVVIEILDARLPFSSMNPVIGKILKHKPCVRVLSKADLADPVITAQWIQRLTRESKTRAIALNAGEKKTVSTLPDLCKDIADSALKRPVRAMIVGIPNVGKSTLINTITGRKIAKTGDQPAVTRQQQRVRTGKGKNALDLFDTPGVLWPNLEDRVGAYRLAASGAVKNTAIDLLDIAFFAARFLAADYPERLLNRYKLETLSDDPEQLLIAIAEKRGCIKSGGRPDLYKVSEIVLLELRKGKLGRISFERPD